mgnify:CR=1 FL=1
MIQDELDNLATIRHEMRNAAFLFAITYINPDFTQNDSNIALEDFKEIYTKWKALIKENHGQVPGQQA